jgi:hypothetical protein
MRSFEWRRARNGGSYAVLSHRRWAAVVTQEAGQ